MRLILSLILLYLVAGVVIVAVQVSSSPCDRPLVLDERHRNISARLEGTLFGDDDAVRGYLGEDVLLWGPRLVEYVIQGGMSFEDFISARECRERF